MNRKQYSTAWSTLRGPMSMVLQRLRAQLTSTPKFQEIFEFTPITFETDAEDFFVSFIIKLRDAFEGTPIVAVDFKLYDEDKAEGANVQLNVDIIPIQNTEWSYAPYNFTEQCFTSDVEELARRSQAIPFDELLLAVQKALIQLAPSAAS